MINSETDVYNGNRLLLSMTQFVGSCAVDSVQKCAVHGTGPPIPIHP